MTLRSPAPTLLALVLIATLAACSAPQRKDDEPIGAPPSDDERYVPPDSTSDDLNRKDAATPESDRTDKPAPPAPTPQLQNKRPDRAVFVPDSDERVGKPTDQPHLFGGEKHLANVRMLTHGGQNAEAYFAFDGKRFVLQSTRDALACDQIFTMNADGSAPKMVSTGKGGTTCAYFYPDGKQLLYASTHQAGPACPPKADHGKYGGYVWRIDPDFDIFRANADGTAPQALTRSPGYDAEATISPTGDRIVFTSMRDGDLELYSMKLDGTDVKRLTHKVGYDGGAFFDRTGTRIVYRAHHPTAAADVAEYKRLLGEHVVKPSVMELFVMNADGTDARQVTDYGAASFAPYFLPDGQRIIFASNLHDPKGRDFDLYTVRVDGTQLERVTTNPTFDGFPMFSPDGKTLVFASNRSNSEHGETNVFVAEWKD